MKPELQLADNLRIPRSFAGRSAFVAGTKGSGKSYTAGVIAEELIEAGNHVLILDPTGVMWGIRSDAKGGPGGYPIIIFGGSHGDVGLQPTAGVAVADSVIKSGQSVILDMSGFHSDAEQDRFVEALLTRLYRAKADARDNLHIIMDEADTFIPQQPMKGQERLIGACKTIVLKGRSRGLGMTMITQRPQAIAKAVIEEADVVFCHRMQGLRAVKAMQAWTDLYATKEQAKEFFETLPTLADGEAWVWSPKFLGTFARFKIRQKRTFDSSRTPDPGERTHKPKAATAVDLASLTEEMRRSAEETKANDPKELRAEIAKLKAELAKKPAETVKEMRVEVPVIQPAEIEELKNATFVLRNIAGIIEEKMNRAEAKKTEVNKFTFTDTKGVFKPPQPSTNGHAKGVVKTDTLTPSEQAVLDAAASFPGGADRRRIAVFSGRSFKSSSFQQSFPSLEARGYLRQSGDRYEPTEAGHALANPTTGTNLEDWIRKLTPSEGKVLWAISGQVPYDEPMTRQRVATITGQSFASSSFQQAFPALEALGLIEKSGPGYTLSDSLAKS